MSTVLAIPLAFPEWESASFFSRSLVEVPEPVDFLALYIPSNPFAALAAGIVPAIVVFSVALGLALMVTDRKEAMLDLLDTLRSMLDRITGFVVSLAPVGVFALMASAAGTLEVDQLGRIQVYVAVYVLLSIVLVFWVLPSLLTFFTPLRWKQALGPARDAFVTAFATGNLLVVLPILARHGKEILHEAGVDPATADSAVDVLVPASFTIPNMGKLISLAFIPFAGWFTGFDLSGWQYPSFAVLGFVSFFGEPVISIPFLLDLFRIPPDTFQLFVTIDAITSRFGTLLAAVHTLVLALAAGLIMGGRWTFRWSRATLFVSATVLSVALPVLGTRLLFSYGVEPKYTGYRDFIELEPLYTTMQAHVSEDQLAPIGPSESSRLEVIRDRGTLRVGFFADALPLAFHNARGDLVGFDVELALMLANQLGVEADFVQIDRSNVREKLELGVCDLVVSGVPITPERAVSLRFSDPVLDLTLAFVVRSPARNEFTSWERIRARQSLELAIGPDEYYRKRVEELLPGASLSSVESSREFFRGGGESEDALVTAAEIGSAWSLVYPSFSVAVPLPDPIKVPVGYPMPVGAAELQRYVDAYLQLKVRDRTIEGLFAHWFEGRTPSRKRSRWSIVRNVLGWID
jgi:Na+/H+-dicarboxylate symporter/ABC-type amino acid transport substrate-binding protein